ncbi:hypothetical protein CK219_26930 [Mesorhizobium sp. WSM4313]|nr:hypothetical protein CK219_26930 [Mesorhizobium sp. WSM4313]
MLTFLGEDRAIYSVLLSSTVSMQLALLGFAADFGQARLIRHPCPIPQQNAEGLVLEFRL